MPVCLLGVCGSVEGFRDPIEREVGYDISSATSSDEADGPILGGQRVLMTVASKSARYSHDPRVAARRVRLSELGWAGVDVEEIGPARRRTPAW